MTIHTKHEHGMFSWTDLSTSDPAAAKKFYGALFGWASEDMPAGPGMVYTMCKLNGSDAAAITQQRDDEKSGGVPPHWNAYITVDNVDERTKKAQSAGGKVLMQPFDVMDVGRMSVVADPTGAALCLWQAKKHIGAQITGDPGSICWAELMTTNVDTAGKFYTSVFGWKAEPQSQVPGMNYTVFKLGDAPVTGMMPNPKDMQKVPPFWLCYFATANCDATAKKAKELGGKLIVEPTDIPQVGRFAVIADPQGAGFGILQPLPRQK